jgi:hypothetical protein
VTPATILELENPDPEAFANFLYLDKKQPWFAQNYVMADAPRASEISQTIMDGTIDFAVWADGEGVVATFPDYRSAVAAKDSARLTMTVNVALPEPEADAVESGAAAV